MTDGEFVGREAELVRLHSLLAQTITGSGQTCFVTGEAGSGKSSLLQEFVRRAQSKDDAVTVVIGRSNAQTGAGDPYLPFVEILAALTDAQVNKASAISETYSSRLRRLAGSSAKVLIEVAPDIINTFVPSAAFLTKIGQAVIKETWGGKGHGTGASKSSIPPGELDSQKIFQQVSDFFQSLSCQAPLVVILDDMHWADAASINLFCHLSAKLKDCPVLLLGTYRGNDLVADRRGERHPLIPALNELKRLFGDILIDLETISWDRRRSFVDALFDTEPNYLDEQFRVEFLKHTSGHPLFSVELLRSFKENGNLVKDADGRWAVAGMFDWNVLPARLEGVVAERIGRVEDSIRDVLVYGSVEGLCFTAQVVARLQNMTEREMLKCLSQELEKRHCLVKEGSNEKIGKNWVSHFVFSHALFQQYLYGELSARQKMIMHGEIADLLEELYRDKRDAILLQLARHYELADDAEKAAACLIRASSLAMRISAYDEARLQLLHALELLEQAGTGPSCQLLELDAQTALCLLYRATRGWNAPELVASCYRARTLCTALELPQRLAPLLFALWSIHLMNLELPSALQLAQEYQRLAEESGNKDMLLYAHIAIGNTLFWMGQLQQGRSALDAAQLLIVEERDYIAEFGQDPGVSFLLLTSFCAWLQGESAHALDCRDKALARADQLNHPFTQAIALYGAATLAHHARDLTAMAAYTARLLNICTEHGFPLYQGLGMVFQGWLDAAGGDTAAGTAQMEQGFRDFISKHGGKVTHSVYCVMRAEALQRAGHDDAALLAVEMGLEVALECAEHCYVPELHRLRAELLASSGAARIDIDKAYSKAIDTSQAQGQDALRRRSEASRARYLETVGEPSTEWQ
jgi:hypothetical protein